MRKNIYKRVYSIMNMEKEKLNARFHYDEIGDSLMISNKEENEIVKHNFMFDDFVISMTGKGKIVGLEIKSASNFLSELGYDPEVLNSIKDTNLVITPKRDTVFIGFTLESSHPKFAQKIPITHIPISCVN